MLLSNKLTDSQLIWKWIKKYDRSSSSSFTVINPMQQLVHLQTTLSISLVLLFLFDIECRVFLECQIYTVYIHCLDAFEVDLTN